MRKIEQSVYTNNSLTVDTPTLQVYCILPTGMTPGQSESYARFRQMPVTIKLREKDILGHFFIGLHTPLGKGCRPYLAPFGSEWQFHVGSTSVELTTEQASDLCACIDEVGEAYLQTLRQTSTSLDLWGYPQVEVRGESGVCLLAIAEWLWPLVYQFAGDFARRGQGTSPWHLFEFGIGRLLHITTTPPFPHVTLSPVFHHSDIPDGFIGLAYIYPDAYLALFEHKEMFDRTPQRLWTQNIGPTGFWTASATETWLVEHCLPQVLAHYRLGGQGSFLSRVRSFPASAAIHLLGARSPWYSLRGTERTPLAEVSTVEQLLPYLENLQQGFSLFPVPSLATELIAPYYQSMFKVMRQLTVTIAPGDTYAWNNVNSALPRAQGMHDEILRHSVTYEQLLDALNVHVQRVTTQPLETKWQADYLTRAFLWILREQTQATCSADSLTNAAQALAPLWERFHFGRHSFDR